MQKRVLGQVTRQAQVLLAAETMPMAAHPRQQSTVTRAGPVQLAPASQEMLVDQRDHMEAIRIRNDTRIRKCLRTRER